VSTIDDRPLVPAYRFVISTDAPDYNAHPLLGDGTFAAFRLLYQDVGAFNEFINSDKSVSPELVAAKMCGRWFDGTPLVVSPNGEDKNLKDFDYTNFNYHTPTPNQQGPRVADDKGAMCPYAAHIRRANPRDDEKVKGNEPVNGKPGYAELHRVLRRATPYGPPYKAGETIEVPRGLVGLFMGANLTDQFQFIMSQWITLGGFRSPDASPNTSGTDPLFGPQISDNDPDDKVLAYNTGNGKYKEMPGLSRFIRTDGCLYLFMPGISGLKYLSQGTIPA
jgi:deferrochelatase/peroxidase EfeB